MSTPQVPFRPSYESCHEVSALCPVRATTMGYYPNLGVNAFLAAGFGLATIVTLLVGVWKRTWGYSLAIAAGCALECVGYASRTLLAENPWNSAAFKTQICTIVLAPTLICIGLYLTLKHSVTALNPSLSRVPPKWYPWFFVPADVSCLVLQGIGGGLASSGGPQNRKLVDQGNRLIIAGIALQVVVLGTFGLAAAEYLWKVRRWIFEGPETPEESQGASLWRDGKFKKFMWAMIGAYVALFIRCIYRIAEMAGGWGNKIMQDEPSFIVLESFMLLIASGLLAAFAPGIFLPQMSSSAAQLEGATDAESSGNDSAEKTGFRE